MIKIIFGGLFHFIIFGELKFRLLIQIKRQIKVAVKGKRQT